MSTIIERGAPRVHGPVTHPSPASTLAARMRALGKRAVGAVAGFGAGLERSFEASRQAAHVTERYLRMTNERLAGHGLTRRDVERRIRDIRCRDL